MAMFLRALLFLLSVACVLSDSPLTSGGADVHQRRDSQSSKTRGLELGQEAQQQATWPRPWQPIPAPSPVPAPSPEDGNTTKQETTTTRHVFCGSCVCCLPDGFCTCPNEMVSVSV
eukprot:528524_1